VVVDDFDAMSVTLSPDETHAILVVDPDRVLSGPVPLKSLQPVSGCHLQVVKGQGGVEQKKLAASDTGEVLPIPVTNTRGEKRLGMLAPVGEDHDGVYPLRQG
jgi:hypothetical protein